ncbi:MAG: FixH family protein [Chthoniobacteraceae bacterium]
MRTFLFSFVGIAILLADAGCGKAPAPARIAEPAPPVAAIWPATRKTDRGNFGVTIRPHGGRIVRNEHFSIEVVLEPGAGAGAPVSVVVDADMPAHQHGMNTKAETVHEGGNRYRANGMLFHMAGEWMITVDVAAGSTKERASFPVAIE